MIPSEVHVLCLPTGGLQVNTYLVWTGNEAVVIDPGGEPERIRAALDSRGLKATEILLTHGHADHIGAVGTPSLQCPVSVHEGDAGMLTDPDLNLSSWFLTPFTAPAANNLLQDGDVLDTLAGRVEVIHTPGHTWGSVCFLLGDLLFTGDTLFKGSIGRTDFPGSSVAEMRRSLARLKKMPPELRVFPGHGPGTTLGTEIATNPFLKEGLF